MWGNEWGHEKCVTFSFGCSYTEGKDLLVMISISNKCIFFNFQNWITRSTFPLSYMNHRGNKLRLTTSLYWNNWGEILVINCFSIFSVLTYIILNRIYFAHLWNINILMYQKYLLFTPIRNPKWNTLHQN